MSEAALLVDIRNLSVTFNGPRGSIRAVNNVTLEHLNLILILLL